VSQCVITVSEKTATAKLEAAFSCQIALHALPACFGYIAIQPQHPEQCAGKTVRWPITETSSEEHIKKTQITNNKEKQKEIIRYHTCKQH
jgi:hypothetical protein